MTTHLAVNPHPTPVAAAFQFLLVVCHSALNYDIQLQPHASIRRFVGCHDEAMRQATEQVLGVPFLRDPHTREQSRYPLRDGGLGLEEAEDRHTTHYLSTLLSDLPQLTQQCLAAQTYPADILTTTGYLPEGNRCIQQLQAEGVYIDHFGLPHDKPPEHPSTCSPLVPGAFRAGTALGERNYYCTAPNTYLLTHTTSSTMPPACSAANGS